MTNIIVELCVNLVSSVHPNYYISSKRREASPEGHITERIACIHFQELGAF